MMRAWLFGSLCGGLQLVLPRERQAPCPAPAPEPWRGLVGVGPLTWPGGSFSLAGNSTLDIQAELRVNDTSPLRRSEVLDVVLPARARRTEAGVLIDSPLFGVVEQLAVTAETEDSARAVDGDPPLYDTRVVYSAFVERNKTWVLVARVRVLSLTPDSCEAPFGPEEALAAAKTPGLTSVASLPGYSDRESQEWDVNCSGVPKHVALAWEEQLAMALEWAGEVHPNGLCLPASHWHWDAEPAVDWVYAELTVLRTAPMTFFMPLGFNGGYMGIQDHGTEDTPGTRYAVFSVWDQGATGEVIDIGKGVEARRFDGELRGFQLVRPLAWEPEEPVQFLLGVHKGEAAEPTYTAYIYEGGEWSLLGSVRVRPCGVTPFTGLGSLNSFIEVFNLQDCESHREATYELWTKKTGEEWAPVKAALLSGTGMKGMRGLVIDNKLALDVGGDLRENATVSLYHVPAPPPTPPAIQGFVPLPASGHVGPDAARRAVLAADRQKC